LAFGQIVSALAVSVIQKGKKMIALFMELTTHGLLLGSMWEGSELHSFVLRLTQVTESLQTELSCLLLECDRGPQHGGHFA
jgi:hypothetical protein